VATFDPSSREAEALAEIAATRIGRGTARALVAGALALLASGPLLELPAALRGSSAIAAPFPAATGGGTALFARIRGRIAELETRFDERSALVRLVRPPAQRLLTGLARYGNEKAIVGRAGWLFFADDVAHLVRRAPGERFAGDAERAIVAFRDALAARGVGLVLLPAPLKPTVHPDRLAPGAAAPIRRAAESDLLARLARGGVEVVDLTERFARDGRLAPLYLAGDTHWRPEAIEIAARELALRLRARFELPPGERTLRESAPSRRSGAGDVAGMLELPAGSGLLAREEVVALAPARGTAPAAGESAAVVLLGDSFAGIYAAPDLGWGAAAGLADRLAAQLGLPVDRIVRNAGGASATRRALADAWRRDPARFAALRAVVWQFAARELSQGEWEEVELPPS
jgi:alginate O-acetyltransferase complex protein AlgJ